MSDQNQQLLQDLLLEKYEPIAICGIGLRTPGNNNTLDEFEEFLRQGGDGIVDIPLDRWDNSTFYDSEDGKGKIRTEKGGYLNDIKHFDAKFFNISPKEADYLDPQQRLVLESSWEALENANIDPDTLRGSNGGVFVGVSSIDYSLEVAALTMAENIGHIGTGTALSAVSGRVSYFLGWRGPCVSIDTACSSSLVAMHQAMNALRKKECNVALCGGVNAIHHPRNLVVFSDAKMLSPSGYCKTFDDGANGYGRSEGCAMVVLKRLSDAIKDNNQIIATLRGSAVNQDGESGGLTVPNGIAQEQVMRNACNNAALSPSDISYVEAHGTGTSLGDPIDVRAINSVFEGSREQIHIGSVKGNIGHTEAAAGIMGVVKTALQCQQGWLYPHVGMGTPSNHIPWSKYIVKVPVEGETWSAPVRRALVNSFGFAGTIASVVIEQAPDTGSQEHNATKDEFPSILTVSAKSKNALASTLARLNDYLEQAPDSDLSQVAAATQQRSHFNHRLAFFSQDNNVKDCQAWLQKQQQKLEQDKKSGSAAIEKIAFLFTGQGAQYSGMGKGYYAISQVYRESLNLCDRIFSTYLDLSIKDLMFGEISEADSLLDQTQYTQAALFSIEYATTRHWMSLGIVPNCLIGHSIGEIVAACIAGVFSLDDAIKLVAHRGRLMQSVKAKGGMLAVKSTESIIADYLKNYDQLGFAALNSPEQCVVSGELNQLEELAAVLTKENIDVTRLDVSHAFHSLQMTSIFDQFREAIADIQFNEPEITLISNVSGEVAKFTEIGQPDYWVRHIGDPVRFADGVKAVAARGKHLCLEVGPARALCNLGRQTDSSLVWLNSMSKNSRDTDSLGNTLVNLYQHGINLNWQAAHKSHSKPTIQLPHYAFDRRYHWLTLDEKYRYRLTEQTNVEQGHPLSGQRAAGDNSGSVVFCSQISASKPEYLQDHKVNGQVVFPGAGYVETLISVQVDLFGEYGGKISDLQILEPLYLSEDTIDYQTECNRFDDGRYQVAIYSVIHSGEGEIKTCHAKAIIHPVSDTQDKAQDLVEAAQAEESLTHRHIADDLYPNFEQIGLSYGDAFQRLNEVKSDGATLAISTLEPGFNVGEFITASLLDCAMQSLATIVDEGKTYLPISFSAIYFYKQPRGKLTAILKRTEIAGADLAADLVIRDQDRLVGVVRGLQLKSVVMKTVATPSLYHELQWKKRSFATTNDNDPNNLLIIGMNDDLEQRLRIKAHRQTTIYSASTVDQAKTLFVDSDINHIVYLASQMTDFEVQYEQLLTLIRFLDDPAYNSRQFRLWLVTEESQLIDGDDYSKEISVSSSLWGFGHSLLNEYPRWQTTMLDLPSFSDDEAIAHLLTELSGSTGNEYQIAWRDSQRFVRRILPYEENKGSKDNFELQVTEYGLFENVKPVTVESKEPEAGEVEIEIRAAGLNFKDVLNALGLLKQHAVDHQIDYVKLPLGFEGAGVITKTTAGSQFNIGDKVMLSHLGCFQKRLTVTEDVVVKMPENISYAEAAGCPTAYITSHYALYTLANIKAGDKVLIHSAAGGVGQAAVQIAKSVGAEIFATASPSKWAMLKEQGIQHLMNSRNLDFSQQVMEKTGGQGVDIILNSLNKDYIQAGLDCLNDQGRFVELGKIGIWTSAQVAEYKPECQYYNFDLSELPEAELNRVNKSILTDVAEKLADKRYLPLPTSQYALDETVEAFSVLSRGANKGKLVLNLSYDDVVEQPVVIHSDKLYLITGGFGALGQAVAGKLMALGAKHIALAGRRVASQAELDTLADGHDVQLYPLQSDIADANSCEAMFNTLAESGLKFGGIFHTAGVLDDGPVRNLSLASLQKVAAAKIKGTDNLLNALSTGNDDSFFVGFSSIASILGSLSQANYAAANAYIDHRMAIESARGRHCLSVNWGPWADIGMAANLAENIIHSIEEKGMKMLKPKQGLRALFKALQSKKAQLVVSEFNWDAYTQSLPLENALFSQLPLSLNENERVQLDVTALSELGSSEKHEQLLYFVRASIAQVLHYEDVDDVESDARFADLGLDSLVAVELKNSIERSLKLPLMTSLVFDYPNITALTEFLYGELWPAENNSTQREKIQDLSDEDVDAELAEMMQ